MIPHTVLLGHAAGALAPVAVSMPPLPFRPPDPLGDLIGSGLGGFLASPIDDAMRAIWTACSDILAGALYVVDRFSTFSVDTHSGTLGALWPTLLGISVAVALGLFFWQIGLSAVHGGRGMLHAATGPVGYGLALGVTVTAVAAALGAADAITTLLLSRGSNATNFAAAWAHAPLSDTALNGVKAVALGLVGFFGFLPAALGYTLEVLWRQAIILVLVATIPITAAGLLARATTGWFWRACRWIAAALLMKPVLALVLVIGLRLLADATGMFALLAGAAVLWVALISPVGLYRLFAFVDPATPSGDAFREQLARLGSGGDVRANVTGSGGGYAGFTAAAGGQPSPGAEAGPVGELEAANTARFDSASPPDTGAGSAGGSAGGGGFGADDPAVAPPPPDQTGEATPTPTPAAPESGPADPGPGAGAGAAGTGSGADGGTSGGAPGVDPPPPPPWDEGGGFDGFDGGGGVRPPGPGPGPAGGGGGAGGGSVGGAAEAAEAAAVIV